MIKTNVSPNLVA